MKRATWILWTLLAAPSAFADAGWFGAGDFTLRNDLLLLNDAEVIRLPVGQWPIPRDAVRYAMSSARKEFATNAAVSAALERVRARLGEASGREGKWWLAATATAGESPLLRDFDSFGRESGELSGRMTWSGGGRFETSLNVTGAVDPADGREIRADNSHASVRWGNWLLSANTLDRWWGPGHDGSLILSSNARPMPTVMVERAEARTFASPWLSWLGPWRFNFGLSQMESQRRDIDAPLFMAWRVSVMPLKGIELGVSRTAQFCGKQLVCDLDSFFNMLAGNDNLGIDATPENEPGNQMAGFDIRWSSPVGNWPYAIYAQLIGEDESSYLPAKYIGQYGLEIWKPMGDGGVIQTYAEYAYTTCSGHTSRGPYYNCAYNQGLFNAEGYRYHGRVIGYTADRDAENYSAGAVYTRADGSSWSVAARHSRLNRDDFSDVRNTVSSVPADYYSVELGWRAEIDGHHISVDLGVESLGPEGDSRSTDPFGYIGWRKEFGR